MIIYKNAASSTISWITGFTNHEQFSNLSLLVTYLENKNGTKNKMSSFIVNFFLIFVQTSFIYPLMCPKIADYRSENFCQFQPEHSPTVTLLSMMLHKNSS